MHCPQKYELGGIKERQRKEVSKTAAFFFFFCFAWSSLHFPEADSPFKVPDDTNRSCWGTLLICHNALAGQESVISDSWNCKDLRGCEIFALIHLIYHLLPAAAGDGERYWTHQSRGVMKYGRWSGMQYSLLFPQTGTYVESRCFQELQFGNCLWSFCKLWPQVVWEKWRETRGNRERRALSLFFKFAASVAALCWEAREQGILMTAKLPENVTNSKFCQANEISWAEPVCCLVVLLQRAVGYFWGGGGERQRKKSEMLLCQVSF